MERTERAVRIYMVEGSPPHIVAEASVPGPIAREYGEGGLSWEVCDYLVHSGTARYLTLRQLMTAPGGRQALEAWRSLDDTGWAELWAAERYASQVQLVERAKALGCPTAAELLDRGAPADEIDEYENAHLCEHDHPRLRAVR